MKICAMLRVWSSAWCGAVSYQDSEEPGRLSVPGRHDAERLTEGAAGDQAATEGGRDRGTFRTRQGLC